MIEFILVFLGLWSTCITLYLIGVHRKQAVVNDAFEAQFKFHAAALKQHLNVLVQHKARLKVMNESFGKSIDGIALAHNQLVERCNNAGMPEWAPNVPEVAEDE